MHQEIARLFEAPFAIDGGDVAISVKCGIARYPQNGSQANELVQNAEAALKEAKTSGEQYLHHRLEMNSALAEKVRMEYRLRTALQAQQFELHYQPKLQLSTGKVVGAEAPAALARPRAGTDRSRELPANPGIRRAHAGCQHVGAA